MIGTGLVRQRLHTERRSYINALPHLRLDPKLPRVSIFLLPIFTAGQEELGPAKVVHKVM